MFTDSKCDLTPVGFTYVDGFSNLEKSRSREKNVALAVTGNRRL